ncbi:autotransporter-associated beta strand repeat-containing protein [Prosthecobacter sp. SYSU 5D2]|uniref:beta strand repeat-containing protein n=1 Tax=Prosthecobacter sp. SYSU 5D2 TaxID=3134134 RepID=UPI0031FF3AFD
MFITSRFFLSALTVNAILTSTLPPLAAQTDNTPGGPYVIQTGELRIAAGLTVPVSSLTMGGAAGEAAALTLEAGAVLDLGGNITFSSVNTPLAATIQGPGTIHLNGTRTIAVQYLVTDPDLIIETVIADGSESSGLTKSGGGSLLLTGANAYTGATVINTSGGSLIVQGNTASIAASSSLSIGAAAIATFGDAVVDTASVNRIGDTASITLNGAAAGGATFNYNGPDLAVAGTHVETAGALTFAGDHRSTLSVQAGAGDAVELRFASLNRTENAVAYVRAPQLGAAAGIADSARLFFDAAPSLTGGILPWAIVDASGTIAFATYDPVRGLAPQTGTVAPASATAGANVLKSTAGTVSLPNSVSVNSWTGSATGAVNLGPPATLGIQSGAMLFTVNSTFNNGSLDLGGSHPGYIHLVGSAGLTVVINSSLTGSQGLTLSGSGAGNKILTLSGSNTLTGGIQVYTGILNLTSAGALNADGSNSLTVQTGGTVRLNGHDLTVSSLSGSGAISSNSGSPTGVLRVHGGGSYTGVLSNGANGALALTKSGNGALVLGGVSTYTGPTIVENGVLHLNATGGNPGTNGRLTATSSVHILQGATLRINKGNGSGNSNHPDRLNDAAPITLAGGTLNFTVNGSDIVYSETLGAVTVSAGSALIQTSQAGANGTSTLTLATLPREKGSMLNFGGAGLGTSLRNRLEIGGLEAGFIGGWATVGNEFAKYVTNLDGSLASVTAFVAEDYTTTHANDESAPWSGSLHVKPAADQGVAQGINTSLQVLSLNLTGGIDLTQGGGTLNLLSGGLLKSGGGVNGTGTGGISRINGGTLTAGGSAAESELFIRVTGANLNIGSTVTDNAGDGRVTLVKSGAGTLNLTAANTFSGGVYLNEGTLRANNTTGSGTGSGSILTARGSVLGGNGFITPMADASITVNGTLSVGNLNDTVAQNLTLSVGGSGTLSLHGIVLLDLFTNAGEGTLHPSTAADVLTLQAPSWQNISFGSSSTLQVVTGLPSTNFVEGDSWKLFDWAGITGGTAPVHGEYGFDQYLLPELAPGLAWDLSQLYTSGLILVMVPEPGRTALLLGGLLIAFTRRRRMA